MRYYASGIEYNHDRKVDLIHPEEVEKLRGLEVEMRWAVRFRKPSLPLSLDAQPPTAGATDYRYHYYLRDHLGNTRVVFTPQGIARHTDYYPFGMSHTPNYQHSAGSHKYLYNGKELQNDSIGGHGLNWYDYGERFYDVEIGRWHSPDALAELARSLTPYRYGFNNPILFIDPDGLWESRPNGWFTDNPEDIQRFFDMLSAESALSNNTTLSQINSFVTDEAGGSLGKLSDGSTLLSGFTMNKNRNNTQWSLNTQEFSKSWMQVQETIDPSLEGQRWELGMETSIIQRGNTFVVNSSDNYYTNLRSPKLRKQFDEQYFKNTHWALRDRRFSYPLKNVSSIHSFMSGIAVLSVPSYPLFVLPTPENMFTAIEHAQKTKIAFEARFENKLQFYYRQYGIIK